MVDRKTGRVYEQIEKAADFYGPSVYELLSFYHSLSTEADPLDGQFIPMTTVNPKASSETLLFAVGLVPPSSNVTGRLLDRSETVRNQLSTVTVSAEEAEAEEVEEVIDELDSLNRRGATASPNQQRRTERNLSALHASIRPLAEKLIQRAAQEGIGLIMVNSHRSIAEQDALYAKGRTAPGGIVTGVKGGESWHNFGLAFDVAIVSPGPDPASGQPTFPSDRELWYIVGRIGKEIGLTWGGEFSNLWDPGHFEYHPGLTKAQARNGARPAVPSDPEPLEDTASSTTTWVSRGASNANKAAKTTSEISETTLNDSTLEARTLGQQYLAAQQAYINMMQAAIEQMANTPPLRLLVNPQSFSVSSEKVIADGSWGRSGPIIEHWGDNQDSIEASGKIAAFYALDAGNANGPGLTRTARQYSKSYQNLLALWLIYKNNGGIYFPDPISPRGSNNVNLSVVGSVYLYYDNILYIGSFDNFNLTETDSAPFTLEYSFSFKVRATFLLDHLDDPQYLYGQPQVPQVPTTTSSNAQQSGGFNEQPSPDVALPSGVEATLDELFGEV